MLVPSIMFVECPVLDDPSPIWQSVPAAPATSWLYPRRPRRWRRAGAMAGLVAAALVLIAGGLVAAALRFGPFERPDLVLDWSGEVALAVIVLATGVVSGWIAAPMAWRAGDRLEWAGAIVGLGTLAVLLGAVMAGWLLAGSSELASSDPVGKAFSIVVGGTLLGVLGLVIYGLTVLPFTLIAALIWAAELAWLKARTLASPLE